MSNGNGALMRIMPFCLLKEEYRRTFNFDDAVGMTHRHPINLAACRFFDVLVNAIVQGSDLKTGYEIVVRRGKRANSAAVFWSLK